MSYLKQRVFLALPQLAILHLTLLPQLPQINLPPSRMESVDVSIKWPFKWCLVGSSGSGKTNFSLQIIKNRARIFDITPSKIIIIYKEFQPIYNEFKKFILTDILNEEDAEIDEINKHNKENLLIICDDLFFSKKLGEIAEQFLVKGRHRNTSWIVLTQSIFNNPFLRNISRNSSHITLFKSIRLNEPHIFFSQLRPKSSKVLQDIYAKATEKSFSYLDIDLSQTCPDKCRYKSNLFHKFVTVYIIMSGGSFKSMYLVNKNDVDERNVQLEKSENDQSGEIKNDFKVSLENKNLCDEGVNLTVKPIKKRKLKQSSEKDLNIDDELQEAKQPDLEMRENSIEKERGIVNKLQEAKTSDLELKEDVTEKENYLNDNLQDIKQTDLEKDNDNLEKESKIDARPVKRKSLMNEIDIQLPKRKTFQPYSFLQENDETSFLPEAESQSKDNSQISDSDKEKATKVELKESMNNVLTTPTSEHAKNQMKKAKVENDLTLPKNDQWIRSLKSTPRTQFKRKKDLAGYRVNSLDTNKSILKPNDFKFLNKEDSGEILDKWKPLSELKKEPLKTKRFKPYNFFSLHRKV